MTTTTMTMMMTMITMMMMMMLGGRDGREMEGEYCDTETFRAECGDGEVIVMRRAQYGRMKLGRCIEMGLGHLGCSRDVLHILDRRCSGKRVCEIRIPDAELESTRPCLRELKTYLDGSFACQSVHSFPSDASCPSAGWNLTLTSSSSSSGSYLSNVVLYHSLTVLARGHSTCFQAPATLLPSRFLLAPPGDGRNQAATDPRPRFPAIQVSARPGQIINVTLIDFAYYKTPSNVTSKKLKVPHSYFQNKQPAKPPLGPRTATHDPSAATHDRRQRRDSFGATTEEAPSERQQRQEPCRKYAHVLDLSSGSSKDILGCHRRVSNVFVSKGHRIGLVLDTKDLQLADGQPRDRFLLNFRALGCTDPMYPAGLTWFKRKSPFLGVAGCHFEEVTWSVTCNDSHWLGFDRECPTATTPTTPSNRPPTHPSFLPTPRMLPGTSKGAQQHKNYSGHRFYEYYVDDASNRIYDAINEDEHRASFDLVASVILIVATFILVVLIFLAIRRLKSRTSDTELPDETMATNKSKKHLLLLSTAEGHVLLPNNEDDSRFCCNVADNKFSPSAASRDDDMVKDDRATPSRASKNHRKNRVNQL